jgi:integrase
MRVSKKFLESHHGPVVVQELLRHASLKVTTDVYMQTVSPQKREAQSKLVRMILKRAGT